MKGEQPRLAVTLGDPSGIGPEVTLKALADPDARKLARFLIVGPRSAAAVARDRFDLPIEIVEVPGLEAVSELPYGAFPLLSTSDEPADAFPVGQAAAASGRAAVVAVEAAVRLALAEKVDAVVTAPLNKRALQAAGYRYPGHTELLGALCGAKATMLLAGPKLRVVHVSVHCSLREAIERVTRENVRATIDIAQEAGKRLGLEWPRIAVAGLNPHAGEGGMFGREEVEQIRPAVEDARAAGLAVSGPWSPDTLFLRASAGEFDIVVAMYHDQGHIPVKLFGLEGGVSVTVGLPIIRTSVDHGTAFDIAGKGLAQHASMLEAIRLAAEMAVRERLRVSG